MISNNLKNCLQDGRNTGGKSGGSKGGSRSARGGAAASGAAGGDRLQALRQREEQIFGISDPDVPLRAGQRTILRQQNARMAGTAGQAVAIQRYRRANSYINR